MLLKYSKSHVLITSAKYFYMVVTLWTRSCKITRFLWELLSILNSHSGHCVLRTFFTLQDQSQCHNSRQMAVLSRHIGWYCQEGTAVNDIIGTKKSELLCLCMAKCHHVSQDTHTHTHILFRLCLKVTLSPAHNMHSDICGRYRYLKSSFIGKVRQQISSPNPENEGYKNI